MQSSSPINAIYKSIPSEEVIHLSAAEDDAELEIDIEDDATDILNEKQDLYLFEKNSSKTNSCLVTKNVGYSSKSSCCYKNSVTEMVQNWVDYPACKMEQVSSSNTHQYNDVPKQIDCYNSEEEVSYCDKHLTLKHMELSSILPESTVCNKVCDRQSETKNVCASQASDTLENIGNEEKEEAFLRHLFKDKPAYNIERYENIKSHILKLWNKCKPSYLDKTQSSLSLKDHESEEYVHCVHLFLEQNGYINSNEKYNSSSNKMGRKKFRKLSPLEDGVHVITRRSLRPRDKKVPEIVPDKVALKGGGCTMEHAADGTVIKKTIVQDKSKSKRSQDPYKLIPCRQFSSKEKVPCAVQITMDALLIIEIHAHCVVTEVIGLLGGYYDEDKKVLHISVAEPCDSSSTKLQCEMDPVSQAAAAEVLNSKGLQVVGWYHSHPDFLSNPSAQDVETQNEYQVLFEKKCGQPFVAIIVSPYAAESATHSHVNCFVVREQLAGKVPYNLKMQVQVLWTFSDFMKLSLNELAYKIQNHSDKKNLLDRCKNPNFGSCMEKLLSCLKLHMETLKMPLENTNLCIEEIRNILSQKSKLGAV